MYWAQVAKVGGSRLVDVILTALDWALFGFDLPVADARYRVLVGRTGTDDVIGVREARTRRQAERALAEVQAIISGSTVAEARAALGLDF